MGIQLSELDNGLRPLLQFRSPRHEYLCLGSFLWSLALLFLSLLANRYFPHLNVMLLPTIGATFVLTICLAIRSILIFREQSRGADVEFRKAEREHFSIFQNVLDAILILDDDGCCLDANPAAIEILRCERRDLVGNAIDRFLPSDDSPQASWKSLGGAPLRPGLQRMVAGDRTQIFVNFRTA